MSVNDIIDKLSQLKLKTQPSTDSASKSQEVINQINQLLSEPQVENSTAGTLNYSIENIENTLSLPEIVATGATINNINNLDTANFSESKMAQQFKPEYLNCIPQFDGHPNDLNRYLAVCQSIVDAFYKPNEPNNFQNIYLLNCIIGKLTGNAKLILGTQNVETWEQLKITLSRHFADQRDEACLNRDLVMLRQQNTEKPNQFYERILHILNLLCSYVNIHETDDNAKNLKRNLYNSLALKTFLSGLKEPLGTTIRCMRPKDLPEALQFVSAEYNTQYFQNISKIPNQKPTTQHFRPMYNQNFANSRPTQQNTFNTHTPHHFFHNQPSFPSQPVPIRPNYNKIPQKFPTNSQVFKNRPNQINVFKPNPNKQFPPPTPMSMSTRQTNSFKTNTGQQPYLKNYFQSQPNQQSNFISEELYNTNTVNADYTDQQYSTSVEQNYFVDDNNFIDDSVEPEYYNEFDQGQSSDSGPSQQDTPYEPSQHTNFHETTQENPKT